MAKRKNTAATSPTGTPAGKGLAKGEPQAARLADKGIQTGADFSRVMAALLADTVSGRIEPNRANAACNVAGKLIRMVEMQHKYGKQVNGSNEKLLTLTPIAESLAQVQ